MINFRHVSLGSPIQLGDLIPGGSLSQRTTVTRGGVNGDLSVLDITYEDGILTIVTDKGDALYHGPFVGVA